MKEYASFSMTFPFIPHFPFRYMTMHEFHSPIFTSFFHFLQKRHCIVSIGKADHRHSRHSDYDKQQYYYAIDVKKGGAVAKPRGSDSPFSVSQVKNQHLSRASFSTADSFVAFHSALQITKPPSVAAVIESGTTPSNGTTSYLSLSSISK